MTTTPPPGYLADRARPAWFGNALATMFVASIVVALAGSLRTPGAINVFENRTLAPRPTMPDSTASLRSYPARFERYFDDRFGMRAQLVHLDHWTRAIVLGVSPVPKVMIGKSGWLYFLGEDAKAFDRWYRGSEPVADATLAATRDELLRRAAFLSSRGIAFIVVVVPEKYTMYPEFLPDWAMRRSASAPLDRVAAELSRYPQLHFIDLREALRGAKRGDGDRLYYKTDSHWNYLGASVGYAEIMREAARALPDLKIAAVTRPPYVAGVDYYSGDLTQMLGLPKQFREDDIAPLGKILATPEARCAALEKGPDPAVETYVYRCAAVPRYSALIYRDSMGIPLVPMLAENFSRTTFIVSAQLDPARVERLQPDIVIQEMVERTLAGVANYPMPR
ncbi:MAG: hypothetical protein ABI981_05910 [Betaproteobacteria bacterium]